MSLLLPAGLIALVALPVIVLLHMRQEAGVPAHVFVITRFGGDPTRILLVGGVIVTQPEADLPQVVLARGASGCRPHPLYCPEGESDQHRQYGDNDE